MLLPLSQSPLSTILFSCADDAINGATAPSQLLDLSSHISIKVRALLFQVERDLTSDRIQIIWLPSDFSSLGSFKVFRYVCCITGVDCWFQHGLF
ncbi:Clarin-3 [Manis pentadactyla]|nr:Clarin-3 [Manis pentadactyla]